MPAFTFETQKFNISLAYDAFTIYFKEPRYMETGRMHLQLAVTACYAFDFVWVPEVVIKPEAQTLQRVAEEVDHRHLLDRFVHSDDDDHGLYHHDKFNIDIDHTHMKFKAKLTREQLMLILDIFSKYRIFTVDESRALLKAYDNHFESTRSALDRVLGQALGLDQESDYQKINQFIQSIEDNDRLEDLHTYLLSEQFKTLRKIPDGEAAIWQGTNELGEVIQTSKTWAMIEKSITLQMGHNIEVGCRFTPSVAKACTAELTQHRFFAVKHQLDREGERAKDAVSPSVKAFSLCDRGTFDAEYNRHFKAIRS